MSEHTPTSDTEAAPETGYVPGNDFTECVREGCPAFHHQYGDRLYFQSRNAPLGVHGTPPCASCGEPSIHRIILRGEPTPVCLRHLNHWRTPGAPETCRCRHERHLHDDEAVPALCMVCGEAEKCDRWVLEPCAPGAPETEALDPEVRLAEDLCTFAHDRPADGSEGPACQECYDLACSVMDTPWLATRDAAQRAAGAEAALREAENALYTGGYISAIAGDWLRERARRIGGAS